MAVSNKPSSTPAAPKPEGDRPRDTTAQRLLAAFGRLPDAIAARMASVLAGQAAPGGVPATGGGAAPGGSIASAFYSGFASILPTWSRVLDREDRGRAAGMSGGGAGWAPTAFRPTSADFGKVDWSDVLAKHDVRVGMNRPGGPMAPGFNSFRPQIPGDVSVDMADVRTARAAARAAKLAAGLPLSATERMQAGGFGSGAHSAAFNTRVGAGPTPGAPTWTPQAPARPSWFGRKWNNAWANIGSFNASARHAWRHRGHFAGAAASRAWGAAKKFGRWIEPTRVMPLVKPGLKHAARWAAARAMNAGARARGAAYSAAGHFRASGFARGVDELASTAMRASKALSPLGIAAGLAKRSLDRFTDFAEDRNSSNERYAAYNPHISQAYSQLAVGDMGRNFQTSRLNQDSIIRLTSSVDKMRSAWTSFESVSVAVGNRAGIVGAEGSGLVGRILGNAVRPLGRWLERNDPGGAGTEAAASNLAKNARGAWNVQWETMNYATLGGLSLASGNGWKFRTPWGAYNEGWKADEKEQEEQKKKDNSIGEDWIKSLNKLATANVGPFMPHRVVAPPRVGRRP